MVQAEGGAETLAHAEALGTDDPWLNLNWAMIHNARGEYSAAERRWKRVLQSDTDNLQARLTAMDFLLKSYKRAGQHDKVVALYEEQIALDPNDAWLRGNFASYLTDILGRNDEAIEQARAALHIMNYGVGRRTLAMALYRKWADEVAEGNAADAEKYFNEGWALYPRPYLVMAYGASMPAGERLAKALIGQRGVSIDAPAEDGSTALLIATNRDRTRTVQMLLDLNADPNVHDRSGWTPLLSAADHGNAEIVNMLLAKGADVRATIAGWTAAALAERHGYTELATVLRKRATHRRN